ncbi:hypothetical protein Agub_g709 [Astrephomene gubernaculifera]|uniref:Guanylate cyclase domain-containing protein n=1 Tax=Astrephomene gubernaculifera TaxID=47775 RepID=A0AAD3DEJ1_9CHLO|nr:hypothetical protein Agub_g709 [Astrephomene gubernaculifera]
MELIRIRFTLAVFLVCALSWQASFCQVVRYTPEYLSCIKGVAARVNCSAGVYTAGDVATGSVPNCALPFWEPANAVNRTTVKLLHPNIVITNTTVIPMAASISKVMQYPLGVDVVESQVWTREPLREFESVSPSGVRQAWFLDPVLTADMADEPVAALQDLSKLVLQDTNLNWAGFGTFFRRFASVYDGKVVGLPVSAAIMLFYYRRDFFEAQGLPVPATWEEVVDIAERYNGTRLEGGGEGGAWGFCMSRQPGCYNGYTFQALQVPFLQAGGTSQGFHFDSDTMRPLLNSSGSLRAAELYRRLSRFTAPTENVSCLPVSLSFVAGNCLMAVGTTLHFKYATFNNSLNKVTRVRGRTGTALLPGSTQVEDRATGRLLTCNETLCPFGRRHTLQNGSSIWVNSAPYAGRGAFTYAINAHSPPEQQYMAYRLCARRVYAGAMWPSVLSATAETTPVRSEMVDPANLPRYTAAGYHPADTLLFMRAVAETVEHSNIALNLRIRGAIDYYLAVDAAAVALTDTSRPVADIMAEAQRAVEALYANTSADWLRQRYWKNMDRKLPPPSPPPPAVQARAPALDRSAKVGVGVGAGLGGSLLLASLAALLGLVAARRYRARRDGAGGSGGSGGGYVPFASEQCTLVVTDVENSTNLWEALPAEVMQAALQLHDGLIRRLLARHGGYESATEGDSFIAAFPTPLAALRFASELQAELTEAKWPTELLQDADICRPLYAIAKSAKEVHLQLAGRTPSQATVSRTAGSGTTATTLTATNATRSSALLSRVSPSASSHTSQASSVAKLKLRAGGTAGGALTAAAVAEATGDNLEVQPEGPQDADATPTEVAVAAEGKESAAAVTAAAAATVHMQSVSQDLAVLSRSASLSEIPAEGAAAAAAPRRPLRAPPGAAWHTSSSRLSLLSGRNRTAAAPAPAPAPVAAPQPSPLPGRTRQSLSSLLRSKTTDLLPGLAPSTWMAGAAASTGSDLERGPTEAAGGGGGDVASASLPAPPSSTDQDQEPPRLLLPSAAAVQRGLSSGALFGLLGDSTAADGERVEPPTPAPDSPAATSRPLQSAATSRKLQQPQLAAAAAAAGPVVPYGGGGGGGALAVVDLGSVGGDSTWTFGWETCAGWQLVDAPAPGAVMVFRGLRVRVGLHSGVREHEMTLNKTSGRITFCGLVMRLAKAVSDAAHGGMIVMSEVAAGLLASQTEAAAALAAEGQELWQLGRVSLDKELRPVELFQLMSPALAPRLLLQSPPRVKAQLLPGLLSAPTGLVALVRFQVAGLAALHALQPALAEEVMGAWEQLLLETLPAMGGYLSETRSGGGEGVVVAFADCGCALAWALCVQADMLHWEWSPELLSQDAFGTIEVETPAAFAHLLPRAARPSLGAADASHLPANASAAAEAAATPLGGSQLSRLQLYHDAGFGAPRKRLTQVELSGPSLLAPLAVPLAGRGGAGGGGGSITVGDGGGGNASRAVGWLKLRNMLRSVRTSTAAEGQGVAAGAEFWDVGGGETGTTGGLRKLRVGQPSPTGPSASGPSGMLRKPTAAVAGATYGAEAVAAAVDAATKADEKDSALSPDPAQPSEPRLPRPTATPTCIQAAAEPRLRVSNSGGITAAATAAIADTAADRGDGGDNNDGGEGNGDGWVGDLPGSGGADVPTQHLLFRGPRTRAVVDVGQVGTEVCRATGRLLYRGRAAKNVAKLLEVAQRGQVICTPAAHAAAAAAAAAAGISLTPVQTVGTARPRGNRAAHGLAGGSHGLQAGVEEGLGGAKVSHYLCSLAPISVATCGHADWVPDAAM